MKWQESGWSSKKDIIKYLILLASLLFICFCFPYTGDDWAWGSSIGMNRLTRLFEGYNGRWIGNLWVIALTRSNILKTMVMAFTMTGTVYTIERITGRAKSFYLSAILILLTPRDIFRQAIVWTSGFSNYSISALCYLVLISYLMKRWTEDFCGAEASGELHGASNGGRTSMVSLLLPAMLAFNNSLYLENLTLVNLAFALLIFMYWWKTEKRIDLRWGAYLTGALAGAVLMFSNGAYHTIAEGDDGFRSFGTKKLIRHIGENYFGVTAIDLGRSGVILFAVILVLAMLISREYLKGLPEGDRKRRILIYASLTVMSAYVSVCVLLIKRDYAKYQISKGTVMIGCLLFAYMLALIYIAAVTAEDKSVLLLEMTAIGIALAILAPMMVVRPIGPRSFYNSYILMVLLACSMAARIPAYARRLEDAKVVSAAFAIAMVCLLSFYGKIFYEVHAADKMRIERINEGLKSGKSVFEVASLPHADYIWNSNPHSYDWAMERFKKFYNIPEDVELYFAEPEE